MAEPRFSVSSPWPLSSDVMREGPHPRGGANARIDVLIPVFNAEPTLEAAVRSIAAQSLSDIRIIAVDDGSTDGSAALLDRLAAEDARVVVLRQGNGGIVSALNHALAAATAEFVARHDGDDIAYPHRFARQIAYLETHPDCVAVSGAARHIGIDGGALGSIARMPPLETADPSWIPSRDPHLLHPFLMARRDAVVGAGGYRHALLCEDIDLYWRLAQQGQLANLDDVLGDYRVHESLTGASLVNGRMMSVNSQLCAISEMRRLRSSPDIAFDADTRSAYWSAGSFDAMVRLAEVGLSEDESAHLRISAAAKMLQWLEFRRYLPDLEDCQSLGGAFRQARGLDAVNRAELRRLYTVIGGRLLRAGRLALARALVPSAWMPTATARALLGRC